jgi:hypothetical protein
MEGDYRSAAMVYPELRSKIGREECLMPSMFSGVSKIL